MKGESSCLLEFRQNLNMKHLPRLFLLLFIGILLAATLPPRFGNAQTVAFEEPVQISPDGVFAWFPDIAVDEFGTIHVVWSTSNATHDMVLYTASEDGTNWSEPNDIKSYETEGEAVRPTLLTDLAGHLLMTVKFQYVRFSRAALGEAANATDWSPDYLFHQDQIGYFSKMVMLPDGVLLAVYTENLLNNSCRNCYHLYARTSADLGDNWSDPVDISVARTGSAKPNLWVGKDGTIHIVWESGLGGGQGQLEDPSRVRYSKSQDGGKTWTTPYQFGTPKLEDTQFKNVTIAEDKNENLIAAFWGIPTDQVYFAISSNNGDTWQETQIMEDVRGQWSVYNDRLDTYSFARDSADNLHLFMVGRVKGESNRELLNVLDLVWDGEAWLPPVKIFSSENEFPEWPRVTISGGNQINLVFFTRDEEHAFESDSVNADYKVWYVKGFAAAPAIRPQIVLTSTARPSRTPPPTSTPALREPTETVTPTLEMLPEQLRTPSEIQSRESEYVTMLGFALVPTLAFILIVVIFVVLRKRTL